MLHRALLINGQWYYGIGPRFSKTNPATNELLWESNEAHASDVERAVAAARDAFLHGRKPRSIVALRYYNVLLSCWKHKNQNLPL